MNTTKLLNQIVRILKVCPSAGIQYSEYNGERYLTNLSTSRYEVDFDRLYQQANDKGEVFDSDELVDAILLLERYGV